MTKNQPTCIACGTALKPSAKVCHACANSQKYWRNELRYWATVAGLFSVIAAAIGYSINVAPEIRKTLFWQDSVEILQFSDTGGEAKVSIANTGDGPVWIEKLSFQAGGSFVQHLDVARTIQPDDVLNAKIYSISSGKPACMSAVHVDQENAAAALNNSVVNESRTAEFVTNPESELVDEGYGIPGTVSVRFLSLQNRSYHTADTDLYAVLFAHYDCEE